MTTRARNRGIALLMVITVLVTLVLVAVPFALSMRMGQERTTTENARDRARWEALTLLGLMEQSLGRTHPSAERQRWDNGERDVASDPNVDSLEEISLGDDFRNRLGILAQQVAQQDPQVAAHLQALQAQGLGPVNDPTGSIWTGIVEDANGKVNPVGAPFLTANLLGSALLAQELDGAATDIEVTNVAQAVVPGLPGFAKDGGWIRIDNEVIRYESFDGTTFHGCERGAAPETPLGDNGGAGTHSPMVPVIDYTAFKLATHLIAARRGVLTYFHNLEDLRSVSEWGGGGVLARDRLDVLRPFLTVWSRRETGQAWLAPQTVTNELPSNSAAGEGGPDEVRLKDLRNPVGTTAYMGAGSLVKITNGLQTAYQTVAFVGEQGEGDTGRSQQDAILTLAGPVGGRQEETFGSDQAPIEFTGGEAVISAYAPFPVDINTAPREVLYAVMANLHFARTNILPDQIVGPELAWDLAGRIVEERKGPISLDSTTGRRERGPFRNVEDWGRWLKTQEEAETLSPPQRQLLYFNAVNPHDFLLANGTAAWCYRTLDVYHLEARVTVNDLGGEYMSSATVSEVVEIGSDAKVLWVLDSQDDFERRLSQGSGAKWVATYPRGVNYRDRRFAYVQPALREFQAVLYGGYPSSKRSDTTREYGEVRLEPARIDLPGDTVRTVAQHFDTSLFTEGWRTDYYGAYLYSTDEAFYAGKDKFPQPFTMAFWWKCGDGEWSAMDCGMDQFTNRYSIFTMDGREGPELVFRVCASTLEERGAEVYVPLERIAFESGTWYHIQVEARGEDPSQMELLVDGVSVGKRRTFTRLSAEATADAEEIQVDSTEGFSPRGAVLIGDEVVEYDSRNEQSFGDCFRGARGTQDHDEQPGRGRRWTKGTVVRQLGYSAPLLTDLTVGGASLGSPLGRWAAVRVNNAEDPATVTIGNASITFMGINANQAQFDAEILPLWGQDADSSLTMGWADGFGESGIALLGSEAPLGKGTMTADGQALGGWEFVYYTRTTGDANVIHIERRDLDRPGWTTTENYFLPTVLENAALVDPAAGGALPEAPMKLHAYLVPISIPASGVLSTGDAYLDPKNPGDLEILARYGINRNGNDTWDANIDEGSDEALLCVGLPTEEEPCEVIRYGSIDTQTGTEPLFVAHDWLIYQLGYAFFPRAFTGGASTTVQVEVLGEPEPASEAARGKGGEVDIPPPGDDVEVPDEDPVYDTHSGGDSEEPTDFGYEGEAIPAVRDPLPYEPPEPEERAATDADYPWPAYLTVHSAVTRFFRGVRGTADREHPQVSDGDRESVLLPCFRVNEGPAYSGEPNVEEEKIPGRAQVQFGGRPVGRGDVVTLTNGDVEAPRRFLGTVRWADPYSRWVSLDSFADVRIPADAKGATTEAVFEPRGRARMLRFPCGELPDQLPKEIEFARSTLTNNSLVTAFMDELFIYRHALAAAPLVYLIEEEGISDSDEDIRVGLYPSPDSLNGVPGYDEECGLVSLDGELIVYRGVRQEGDGVWVLEDCARGVLGTEPRPHGYGGYGRFVTDVPVTYIQGNMTRETASIAVPKLGPSWPREGLLRIVGSGTVELVHYTRRGDEAFLLPEALDADEQIRGRGLMRGRFGTDITNHDRGELIFYQPFRYWDRYLPRRTGDEDADTFSGVHDHPEAAYLELGQHVRSAYWDRIGWKEDLEGAQGGETDPRRRGGSGETSTLDILVLARLNHNVPWDSNRIVDLRGQGQNSFRPTTSAFGANQAEDVLYVFDDPEAANRIGKESDNLEIRVYFVYRPGSFLPQDIPSLGGWDIQRFENTWKRTPWFKELDVEYTSRTTTLSRSFRR